MGKSVVKTLKPTKCQSGAKPRPPCKPHWPKPNPLTVAVSLALGLTSTAQGQVLSGSGNTTVTASGPNGSFAEVLDVTTTDIRGNAALNRFSQFNVNADTNVRLHLPTADTSALVNLISGGQASVHGLVQGLRHDGNVGGDLYFVSPQGFVVGETGTLQAGSLTIATPEAGFLDAFGSTQGSFDSAFARLRAGDFALHATGVIEVRGRLEAERSVLLYSRGITVGGSADSDSGIFIGGDATNTGAELFAHLVNTQGLMAGTALKETAGGALVIVGGAGGVRVEEHARLDAADGDLLITAADFNRHDPDAETLPGLVDNWFKPTRKASADITIEGQLAGANVTLVAVADAAAEWVTPNFDDLENLAPGLKDEWQESWDEFNQSLPSLDGAVAVAEANARVIIADTAEIDSAGDVTLEAHASRSATAEASAEDGRWLGAAAAYGRVAGETLVQVQEGAAITAPGSLSLLAVSENTLKVSAKAVSDQDDNFSLAGTAAVGEVKVTTTAELSGGLNGDDSLINVGDLSLEATSRNDYSTTAEATAEGGVAIGLAAAVSLIETDTRASLSGTLTASGDVSVLAFSHTSGMVNTVVTSVSGGDDGDDQGDDDNNDDQLSGWLGNKLTDASDRAEQNQGDDDSPAAGSDGGLGLKIGAAVAYLDARETATAELKPATRINPLPDGGGSSASAGDVAIVSRRELEGLRNHAVSGAESQGDDGEGGVFSLSAGVAVGFIEHDARALVGDDSVIRAHRLGLSADVLLTPNGAWGEEGFAGIDDLGGEDFDNDQLTSYASAGLTAGSDTVAVSGALSYLSLESTAQARLGERADVQLSGVNADWSTTLGSDEDAPEVSWDGTLAVLAGADVRTVDVAGNRSESGTVGIGGGVAWTDRRTTASAVVDYDAQLITEGDVRLAASRHDQLVVLTPVSGKGAGEDSVFSLNAAVAYGRLAGTTEAVLAHGAGLTTPGDLSLAADSVFVGDVAAVSTLQDGGTVALAGTVAYASIQQTTRAQRTEAYSDPTYVPADGLNPTLTAGNVTVTARYQGSYNIAAKGTAESRVAVGLAAAVADIETSTQAGLSGTVQTGGDVAVVADSLTSSTALEAETSAAAPSDDDDDGDNGEVEGDVAADGTQATAFAKQRSDDADSKVSDDVAASEQGNPSEGGSGSGDTGFDLRLSAAAALLFRDESAEARLADGTQIGSASERAGDVVVVARRQDEGLTTLVKSATEAKVDDDGVGIAVSAALSFVQLSNRASSLIGANAEIWGQRIGVGSLVRLPDHFRLPNMDDVPDWENAEDFESFAKQALENGEELVESWFTTYASATSSSENSTLDLAGAVNYLNLSQTSEAWVADGALLNASGQGDDWSYTLAEADPDEELEADIWDFAHTVTVAAQSYTSTIDLAGNLAGLTSIGVDAGGTTAAVGGGFAWSERSVNTVAGVGAGVAITLMDDGTLGVTADAHEQAITIAPSSGRGATAAVNGTVAVTRTNHNTIAILDRFAAVDAASIVVQADQWLTVWSVAGAIALGENIGVGLSTAVNDLATDTRALIGDSQSYRPDNASNVTVSADAGDFRTESLALLAETRGLIGAAAIAGAKAGESDKKGGGDTARDSFDARTADVQSDSKSQSIDSTLEEPADRTATAQTEGAEDGAQGIDKNGDSADSGADFSIAVSGSAGVNLTALTTVAELKDARVTGRGADPLQVQVQALNDTDMYALAGAGALTDGGKQDSFSAAIAGAVAINQLTNQTQARVIDAELVGIGAAAGPGLSVDAMTAGELIGVGLGVAADTGGGDSSLTLAGSVSLGMLRNGTVAEVVDTDVTGQDADPADVRVLAYDRSRIATGGGALTYGGRVGIGVAVTYADVANQTRASVLGSTLTDLADVNVGAYSASRIISAAAGLQASTGGDQGVGFAGSVTINRIANQVTADVADGSVLELSGDLSVQAASVSGTSFADRIASLDSQASSGTAQEVNWSGAGTEIEGNEEGDGPGGIEDADAEDRATIGNQYEQYAQGATAGGVLDGEAILGIAGNIQVGKAQNSIGLSFSGNFIDNQYDARIVDATVTANAVAVEATQSARILGLSVGAAVTGGKFAGLGSGTANIIGLGDDKGRVRSTIHDSVVQADDVRVLALNAGRIDALAGNVSYASKAAFGAAIGYNEIGTLTEAVVSASHVRGFAADTTADTLRLAALSLGDIYAIAAAGSGSSGVALAGSANINRLNQTVNAHLHDSILTVTDVDVSAGNSGLGTAAEVWALTGNITIGKKGAVGAAFAWNEIGNAYNAEVASTRFVNLDSLDISAETSGKIRTLTASGGLGGTFAVNGAGAYSVITAEAAASLVDSDVDGWGQSNVSVRASDDSDIFSVAASLAASKSASGGVAIGVNDIRSTVTASVAGGPSDNSLLLDNLLVDAVSETRINNIVAGMAAAGKVGAAGSAASNLVASHVLANVTDGALVDAAGDVRVKASSQDEIQLIGGSLGVGVKALGAAVTVGVNLLDGQTRALIDGGASVTALGGAGVSIGSGELDVTGDRINYSSPDGSSSSFDETQAGQDYAVAGISQGETQVRGVAVNASSLQSVGNYIVTAGISPNVKFGVGLAGTVSVNMLERETVAAIENATVHARNADGSSGADVTVSAAAHADTRTLVVGAAFGSVGAAGAVATDVFDRTTTAGIFDADVKALDSIDVAANTSQTANGMAIGAAGGTWAGVAGGGVLMLMNGSNQAVIQGSQLAAADITVDANYRNILNLTTANAGASLGGGAAASFAVGVVESSNIAQVDDSELDVANHLHINAETYNEVRTIAASGAIGGAFAGAAMASATVIGSETYAQLIDSNVNNDGEASNRVTVQAADALAVRAWGGGLSVSPGGVALGGSATVLVGRATVAADVVDTDIKAEHVMVDAQRDADIEAYTLTVGAGSALAFSAGVGVVLLGGNGAAGVDLVNDPDNSGSQTDLMDDLDKGNNGTLSALDNFGSGQLTEDNGNNQYGAIGLSGDQQARISNGTRYQTGAAVRNGGTHETRAEVSGGRLDVTTLAVDAREGNRTINLAGAGAVAGTAGIGGSAAVTHVASVVTARVNGDVQFAPNSSLSLNAASGGRGALIASALNLNDIANLANIGSQVSGDRTVLVISTAGAAGGVGLGAAYAHGRAASTVSAQLGGAVNQHGTVATGIEVTATDNNSVGAFGIGAGLGAAAAGLVVGFAEKASVVDARILNNAQITTGGELSLLASATGQVTAAGVAAAGGVIAGAGSVIIASDDVVARTRIGANSVVQSSHIRQTAEARARTVANAYAASIALAQLGVSWAEARARSVAENIIGNNATLHGRTTLNATTAPVTGYAADAQAWAGGGSKLLSVNGAFAQAYDNAEARAQIGNGVTFTGGGAVSIGSEARPAARARAYGVSLSGVAAFGGALAVADAKGGAFSQLGNNVSFQKTSQPVTINAHVRTSGSLQTARAEARAGAGAGLVGGSGAKASATSRTQAQATLGSGAVLPGGNLTLDASSSTNQRADATGLVAAGVLAVGLVDAFAGSNTTTLARLGHSPQAFGNRAGNITLKAVGHNTDRAYAVSGAGGLLTATAARTGTSSVGKADAIISDCPVNCPTGSQRTVLQAGNVSLEARHTNNFGGTVDSRSAHVAGYSGARGNHTALANANVEVGRRADLDLGRLTLQARTVNTQPNLTNLQVASGGVLNAAAASSNTQAEGNARIQVGADANIRTRLLNTAAGSGNIQMEAVNVMDLRQHGKLDTGGAIDRPEVNIVATGRANALIDIGSGAVVGAAQDLLAAAWSAGDVNTSANVKTYGLAGAARGHTRSTFDANNTVMVRGRLSANRDVYLAAGLDLSRAIGGMAALADTYIWNKTVFPVQTDPTARARMNGDNHITITGTGEVIAGRDADLLTTWQRYQAYGVGIGKDLYREVLEKVTNTAVKILTFGQVKKAVSLEIRRVDQQVSDHDQIRVDGRLVAGAGSYQFLWIKDEYDANGNPIIESSLGINYTITERDIADDLAEQLAYYEGLMQQYAESGSALFWRAYAQALTLRDQLADINELRDDDGNLGDAAKVKAIELDDIETLSGNITLTTSSLRGSGTISLGDEPDWNAVPGAPAEALKSSGGANVRLVNESSTFLYVGDITLGNTVGRITHNATLGGSFFRMSLPRELNSQSNIDGLSIQGIDPGQNQPEVFIVNTYLGDLSGVAPEIHLLGNISNRNGRVILSNVQGSIISSGNIDAASVSITAGGRFVQNFTTGFTHIAGAPDREPDDIMDHEGQILAGGAIYISGEFVNINGLVQSGVADYSLTITQAQLDAALANAPASQNQVSLSGLFSNGTANLQELLAYYDRDQQAIVVRPAQVNPGYIFIFGDVVSTGGGRLAAVSGYGDITVNNQTSADIILEGLDAGTGGNGIIEILDLGHARLPTDLPSFDDLSELQGLDLVDTIPAPRLTVFEHSWETNTLTKTQSFLVVSLPEGNNGSVDVVEVDVTETSLGETRETIYQPKEDRIWVRRASNPLVNDLLLFFGSLPFFNLDVPAEVLDAEMLVTLGNLSSSELSNLNSGSPTSIAQRADKPVAIEFLGGSTANLSVTSNGSVSLAGELRNLDGLVSVNTDGALFNPGAFGGLVGERIEVTAGRGFGTDNDPVQLQVGSGAVHMTTTRGDVYLLGRGTPLLLDHIRSDRGDIYITSELDIVDTNLHADMAIKGRSILLESLNGQVGAADQLLRIETGHAVESQIDFLSWLQPSWLLGGLSAFGLRMPVIDLSTPAPLNATLTAAAETGVYIEEVAGDLHVNLVAARDGDVVLKVSQGGLINALGRGALDFDAIDNLRALWDDMRLTGDDAEQAALESVSSYERSVETRYQDYWQLRNFLELDAIEQQNLLDNLAQRFTDEVFEQQLLVAGFNEAEAAQQLDQLTGADLLTTVTLRAQFQAGMLESQLAEALEVDDVSQVAGFDSRDADWSFSLDQDSALFADIIEGAVWTEQELLNSISANTLIDIDSTLYEQVEPNIVGNNITLLTADSVGSMDDPVEILLPQDLDADSFPDLTDAQLAALLAAQPGDIRYVGGTFNTVTGEFEGNITAIIINRTLVIGVNAGGDDGLQGALNLATGGNAFIVSPLQTLTLDQVNAPGDVRIQVRGDLLAADHGQPVILGAADGLLLEAEGGTIGSADRPLLVNLEGGRVTARAANGLYLTEQSGDLLIDRINTVSGTLVLTAEDGSIIARDDDELDLAADDIRLVASGDVTGGGTLLQGVNLRHGDMGHVGGSAGGEFRILDLNGSLRVDDLVTGGLADARAQDDVDASNLQVGGDLYLEALLGDLTVSDADVGGEALIRAQQRVTADKLDVAGRIHMQAREQGIIVNQVAAGAAGADALVLISADTIRGGAPIDVLAGGYNGAYHLKARGEDAELRLLAPEDVGEADQHLVVSAPVLNAISDNGSIYITALDDVQSGELDASAGRMELYARAGLGTVSPVRLRVLDALDLRGDTIRAHITHTANPRILPMDLQAIDGGQLTRAELEIDAPNGLEIGWLHGQQVLINTTANWVNIVQARVSGWLDYQTPQARVYINNQGDARNPLADVQLFQPSQRFFITQDGRLTFTNAFVLRYRNGWEVRVPNYSAARDREDFIVDGRAGERQTTAWAVDFSDGDRWSRTEVTLVELTGMVDEDAWTFMTPTDLTDLEASGLVAAAFGQPLRDRTALELRQEIQRLEEMLMIHNVRFELDSHQLQTRDWEFLNEVARVLARQPHRRVRIKGFTDNLGSPDYNDRLSAARAASVMQYLAVFGVKPEQMELVGFGADEAVASNDTEEGRSQNRRVEITLLPDQGI
ncbi:MAG: leukotoxin LktA family filamentous adhesin [Marinobacter sp.]|nr:leukotoxin LktA family filamentous adhesin [Marinobacter sp.]